MDSMIQNLYSTLQLLRLLLCLRCHVSGLLLGFRRHLPGFLSRLARDFLGLSCGTVAFRANRPLNRLGCFF